MTKYCKNCKKTLRQKENEKKGNFKRRVYCDLVCAGKGIQSGVKVGRVTVKTVDRMNKILITFKDDFDIYNLREIIDCPDYVSRLIMKKLVEKKRVVVSTKKERKTQWKVISKKTIGKDDFYIIKKKINKEKEAIKLSYTDRLKKVLEFYHVTNNRELQHETETI